MSGLDCDVLVVGAGPTGICLALIAAQHGASAVICEKEADIYPLPRAAHIDHEVMRIFQSIGAADQISATSRTTSHYDFLTADGQILLRFDGSDQIGPGGWPGANMIHQPSLERALRNRLPDTNRIELRSLWRFVGYEDTGEFLSAKFETPEGPRTVTARFLVGTDGTRSPVRAAAGIELDDLQFDEPWLVIDTIVQDFERLPKVNLQICDPARPTTCVLMGEGRHRWEFMMLPGETPEQVLDDAFIEGLLKPWKVDGAVTWNARPSTVSMHAWRSRGKKGGSCSQAMLRTRHHLLRDRGCVLALGTPQILGGSLGWSLPVKPPRRCLRPISSNASRMRGRQFRWR
jgi:3-(3-hydroxy-phenyl)propionate hydroxylase